VRTPQRPKLCLFGASGDTGNLGVSALFLSVLQGIASRLPEASITVFDEGWGARSHTIATPRGPFQYRGCGAHYSKRLYRPESMWNIRASCRLGGFGNAGARAVLDADAILDVSGGDSFTDLYGTKRFRAVTLSKQIALENDVPLILLPQTYGPFASAHHKNVAESIVRRATMAWARDHRSFEILQELAGDDFDPARHREGVDVAFALEAKAPALPLPDPLDRWLEDRACAMVGINISGLLYNDPTRAARQYGLRADYRQVIHHLIERLLRQYECRIVLIPHVVLPDGHLESDITACEDVFKHCRSLSDRRLVVAPAFGDPREAKWLISRCDWFCGTRMHSAIAALSSAVPTAAIAYSDKVQGVFESCGQGNVVLDPRTSTVNEIVERALESFQVRSQVQNPLAAHLSSVLRQSVAAMDEIVNAIAHHQGVTAAQ
jgi:colanic acid/amylovoran biosynthesis protein